MKFLKFFIFLIFLIISNSSFALSLEEYLAQTKEQNLGYKASQTASEASDLLSNKAFLLTSPNLFATAQNGFEKQNQAVTFVRYAKLKTENYSIGVEQDFSFGLNGKLYYNVDRNEYEGLTSTSFTPISYQTNPVLQLTVPLWQGVLGSEIKARRDLTYYSNQADQFNSKADSVSFMIDAEKSYWQLVMTKEIVIISKDALTQAQKLLQSAVKKARMNLGEKADVLQAQADVENKKLQLKQAENEARIAARNFNQKRYVNSDIVKDKLSEINFNNLEKLFINKEMPGIRADVKAAAANTKSAVASAKVEEESNKPKLDLSGQYGFNGLETRRSEAINSSFAQSGDEAYIGIKFSMPLAIGLQSDIKKGAKASASAARMDYRQKVFDQQNDWQNLLQNLQDYQENLRLSRKIENLQKLKLTNERSLLKQGRTSTYQVLLFEQDYNQARINTIKNAYQLLNLIAEKKNYDSI
jgi:outer membrane protein TolC